MKIWRGNENTDDKIIAFLNSTIYKGNPENNEIENCINDLKKDIVPQRDFIGIPLHYIKEIRLTESKNFIEIIFGQSSEEHLIINDPIARNEIFNYFKQNIPGTAFSIDRYSKLRAGKKPLIAMGVITILFLWSLYYAIGFDEGNQYEITNGHYNSLTGIILAIAEYGTKNVILVFTALLAIAIIAFIRKIKHPPVISRLVFVR